MLERLEEGFKAWDQEEEASWGEKGVKNRGEAFCGHEEGKGLGRRKMHL